MSEITEAQVRELLELSEKASRGPWDFSKYDSSVSDGKGDDIAQINEDLYPYFHAEDGDFIAAARNLIPALAESWLEMAGELQTAWEKASELEREIDPYWMNRAQQ